MFIIKNEAGSWPFEADFTAKKKLKMHSLMAAQHEAFSALPQQRHVVRVMHFHAV